MCRPEFLKNVKEYEKQSLLDLRGLRHPCVEAAGSFIPNDTVIDTREASMLLVTGPNMGGKSTLLR